MRNRTQKTKIGLLRELTNGNLGNAAFEAAVVQHLIVYFPQAEIYVACLDSLETLKSYNVRLFPIDRKAFRLSRLGEQSVVKDRQPGVPPASHALGWLKRIPLLVASVRALRNAQQTAGFVWDECAFWARSYRFVRDFQLLIVCGGGQLSDWWGGPWEHPYRLFMWSTLAKISRTRLIVLDVGAEQVSSALSRWFLKCVLSRASYRSYRDEDTRRTVEDWGIPDKNHVYPDLAFSLNMSNMRGKPRTAKPRPIGISPMPYCDPRVWPIKDAAVYRRYLANLASFARDLIERGYVIALFVSQVRMDMGALQDLKELIIEGGNNLGAHIVEPYLRTVDDLLSLLLELDLVVASRMHGILLSQLAHTPTLAISYESKVDSLMASFGLAEYCLDIHTIEPRILIDRFAMLESNRERVAKRIESRVAEYRDALENQYEVVFGS